MTALDVLALVNRVAQRHNLVHVKVRGQRLARPALLVVGSVILVTLPDSVLRKRK